MVGFEKVLGAVKVIKDQIHYGSQSLLDLARGCFRLMNFFFFFKKFSLGHCKTQKLLPSILSMVT